MVPPACQEHASSQAAGNARTETFQSKAFAQVRHMLCCIHVVIIIVAHYVVASGITSHPSDVALTSVQILHWPDHFRSRTWQHSTLCLTLSLCSTLCATHYLSTLCAQTVPLSLTLATLFATLWHLALRFKEPYGTELKYNAHVWLRNYPPRPTSTHLALTRVSTSY